MKKAGNQGKPHIESQVKRAEDLEKRENIALRTQRMDGAWLQVDA